MKEIITVNIIFVELFLVYLRHTGIIFIVFFIVDVFFKLGVNKDSYEMKDLHLESSVT